MNATDRCAPRSLTLPPPPTPQSTDDEDLNDYLQSLRSSCLSTWGGILQAYSPAGDVSEAEAVASRQRAIRVLGAAYGGQLVPSIFRVATMWATQWRAAQQIDQGWEFNGDLGKGLVGLFVDLAVTFGTGYMHPHVSPIRPLIDWIFTECHKWEVADGIEPGETIVSMAKKRMNLR